MYRKAIFAIIFVTGLMALQSVADAPDIGKEITPPETKGSVMVAVPAGDFLMGINRENDDRYYQFDNEKPLHKVYLEKFYIDKYEATVDQYKQCARAGKCKKLVKVKGRYYDDCNWIYKNRGDHPMSCIDWRQAEQYCQWAGKRLPTEAEWEKAARGTDGRKYPWGNEEPTCVHAVFNYEGSLGSSGSACGEGMSFPVGSKPKGASPYGAMDMAGNVREWVADRYFEDYYRKGPAKNPKGPETGERRVIRGGNFDESMVFIRTTYRHHDEPGVYAVIGVRCAMTPQ